MSRRMQDAALGVLALITVVLVVWAFAHTRAEPPGGSSTPEGDSTNLTATAGDQPGTLEAAAAILDSAEPVTVTVLGDSTSNNRSEWVHLWATDLAQERPVTIRHWNEQTQDAYVEPDVLSQERDSGELTIFSGSQTGASASYPVTRLEQMVPEDPDLVVLSFGHNNTAGDVGDQLSELRQAITAEHGQVPTVVVLQNPQANDANAGTRQAVETWAQDAGLATIDVAAAFAAYDGADPLLVDALHPSEAGSRLWADTVAEALGTN